MLPFTSFRAPSQNVRILVLVSTLLVPLAASAQMADGLTPFDIARLRMVGSATLSPDGAHAAYLVSNPQDPFEVDESARLEIRLMSIRSGDDRLLVSSEINGNSIAWTPDGMRISFRARMEGDDYTSLYSIGLDGQDLQKVASADRSIGSYDWSHDGRLVAFVASEGVSRKASSLPVRPEVYEETVPFRKVWIARAYDTDAAVRMLDHEGSASSARWSPDGRRLVAAIAPTGLVDDSYMSQRLHVFDASSGNVVARIDNPGKIGRFDWSPDGEHIALISGIDINDPSEGRLMVASSAGGSLTDLLPDLEGHVTQFSWAPDNSLRYLADVGVGMQFGSVSRDGTGARTTLESDKYAVNSFSSSDDGRVSAFVISSPEHPSELYVRDSSGKALSRLTDSNPWLASVPLARQEIVRFLARDGLELEGLLIRPLSEEPGRRYPLITVVHGGPESHYSNGWLTGYSTPGQVAAAKGIAVFYPNYRGSTGRGVEFSKTSQADPAGKEFDDVVDAVDHLIETGLVDADRVGVTGGSYGGNATAWMSTYYSERFAAGVMFVGISNKVSKVGTTDIPNEEYHVHARKRPWDDWQFFLERSPVYYADRGQTPLLIMHGAEDPRVNPGQSRELYRHLKLRGTAPVRLVFYPGEGHGNRTSAARLDYSLRAMRWMEHYLAGPGGDAPAYPIDVTSKIEVIEPTH